MQALLTEGSLSKHLFLNGSDSTFLNHLEAFSHDLSFEKGDVIFRQGQYADRLYLIREGRIQLETGDGTPGIVLQVLGAGDILGWSWLYPPFVWHFSARALEHCEVVKLDAASLLIRAEEDPSFGYELMKRISKHVIQRLQITRDWLSREIGARERTVVGTQLFPRD
jgi:CRP/FNR family transcriptional regulator, cyclic AMP receptor protein